MDVEYHEELVLNEYVWLNCVEYMNDLEKRVHRTVVAEQKAEHADEKIAALLRQKWSELNQPDVSEALESGLDVFQTRVRKRIVTEHPGVVNRCPACQRVARTPNAKQCRWCYHDWH